MAKSDSSERKLLLGAALRYLSFRPRSSFEMTQYLNLFADKKNYSHNLIPDIMDDLIRDRFLDDKRFSSSITKTLFEKGKGPFFIKQKLLKMGFADTLINQTLSQYSKEEIQTTLSGLIANKMPSLTGTAFEKKAKLSRFLSQRGFSFSDIMQAIDSHSL